MKRRKVIKLGTVTIPATDPLQPDFNESGLIPNIKAIPLAHGWCETYHDGPQTVFRHPALPHHSLVITSGEAALYEENHGVLFTRDAANLAAKLQSI